MAVTNTSLPALASTFLFTDTVSANAAIPVKASSATLYAIDVDNTANASASYTKIWNVASGSVVVGTTVPDMIILVPASTRVSIPIPAGIVFGTALSEATVTTAGTAGTTSPSSSVIVRLVYV